MSQCGRWGRLRVVKQEHPVDLPTVSKSSDQTQQPCALVRVPDPSPDLYETMNHTARAKMAAMTLGIAPTALTAAFHDWAVHLASAPGKQLKLVHQAMNDIAAIATYATRCGIGADPGACIHPRPHDRRFEGEAWRKWPYNIMAQSFLAQERWWSAALTDVPGETTAHERVADFVVRQVLDTMAPSNFLAANPEVQAATLAQGGQNLLRGAAQFAGDVSRTLSHEKPPEIAA